MGLTLQPIGEEILGRAVGRQAPGPSIEEEDAVLLLGVEQGGGHQGVRGDEVHRAEGCA